MHTIHKYILVNKCMHSCNIHSYLLTYMHTYFHAYIPTCINTVYCIHTHAVYMFMYRDACIAYTQNLKTLCVLKYSHCYLHATLGYAVCFLCVDVMHSSGFLDLESPPVWAVDLFLVIPNCGNHFSWDSSKWDSVSMKKNYSNLESTD